MADLKKYCPSCLDKWATPTKVDPVTQVIIPRLVLHPQCRKALEAIFDG